MSRSRLWLYLGIIVLLFAGVAGWYGFAFLRAGEPQESPFDGLRAFSDVEHQVALGPRTPASGAHDRVLEWMETELTAAGWTVERHETTSMGHPVINLIAYRTPGPPDVLLGAHYDTRLWSDHDPNISLRAGPGPGANDGASGVAVLLELARTLPQDAVPIRLVFFDAEDNGRIPGWDWLLGSKAYVASMDEQPASMVLLDMVGDADLTLPMEGNSDPVLWASIRATAVELGHGDVFLADTGLNILDDHIPFIEAGVPAVDIIDFDYSYWHTTADTPDKLSPGSLQIVGDVLWTWLVGLDRPPPTAPK